jgi:hypothetical protein
LNSILGVGRLLRKYAMRNESNACAQRNPYSSAAVSPADRSPRTWAGANTMSIFMSAAATLPDSASQFVKGIKVDF